MTRRPIFTGSTVRLQVTVPEAQAQQIHDHAQGQGMNDATWIRQAITEKLTRDNTAMSEEGSHNGN